MRRECASQYISHVCRVRLSLWITCHHCRQSGQLLRLFQTNSSRPCQLFARLPRFLRCSWICRKSHVGTWVRRQRICSWRVDLLTAVARMTAAADHGYVTHLVLACLSCHASWELKSRTQPRDGPSSECCCGCVKPKASVGSGDCHQKTTFCTFLGQAVQPMHRGARPLLVQ